LSGEKGWRERKVGKRKRLDGKEGYAGRKDGRRGRFDQDGSQHT